MIYGALTFQITIHSTPAPINSEDTQHMTAAPPATTATATTIPTATVATVTGLTTVAAVEGKGEETDGVREGETTPAAETVTATGTVTAKVTVATVATMGKEVKSKGRESDPLIPNTTYHHHLSLTHSFSSLLLPPSLPLIPPVWWRGYK